MMKTVWIVAQAGGGEAPTTITSEPITSEETQTMTKAEDVNKEGPVGRRPGLFDGYGGILFIVLAMLVFYFMMFRGPRKQQQEHRQMVQSLEKNDRIRTIGGIIGTVVDIKGDEITLKIDESNNTKIKVVSSAIGKNLSKEKK